MSKAKKSTPQETHDSKGFLNLAGEAFAVLGGEIVEGKDKVVEVVGEKITDLKSAISRITHKKKAAPKKKSAPNKKAAPKKKAATKKAAPAKKAAPKKKSAPAPKKKSAPAPKKKAAPQKKAAPKKRR